MPLFKLNNNYLGRLDKIIVTYYIVIQFLSMSVLL